MTDVRRLGGLSCAEADDQAAAFVLGALEPEMMAAVREHLAECPETHETFERLGGSAASLTQLAEPVEPPAALKARLMAAIATGAIGPEVVAGTDTASESATTDAAIGMVSGIETSTAPDPRLARQEPVSLATERARRRPLWFAAAAAAAIVILVLGASNLALRGELDATAAQAEALRQAVSAVGMPGATVASVTGTDAQPDAAGFVVLPPSGDGYMAVHGLLEPPSGQTYEAWTIGGDGVPVPASLASPRDGLAVFVLPAGASPTVVALTIEPMGGSDTPTLPIQASGTIGS